MASDLEDLSGQGQLLYIARRERFDFGCRCLITPEAEYGHQPRQAGRQASHFKSSTQVIVAFWTTCYYGGKEVGQAVLPDVLILSGTTA